MMYGQLDLERERPRAASPKSARIFYEMRITYGGELAREPGTNATFKINECNFSRKKYEIGWRGV